MDIYRELAKCVFADQTGHLRDMDKLSDMMFGMFGDRAPWTPEQQRGIMLGLALRLETDMDKAHDRIVEKLTTSLRGCLTEEEADRVFAFLSDGPLQDLLQLKHAAWMQIAPLLGDTLRQTWQDVMAMNPLDLIPTEN